MKIYFDNINLLRAFAAISVLIYHVIELFPWQTFPVTGSLVWFRIGWLGVDLFFVISGFVITLALSQLFEQQRTNFYSIYLRRRLARIAPLYLLTGFFFILFCAPSLLKDPSFYKNLGSHLLFVHNLNINTHGAIDGPNWSIGVEIQFYLLMMVTFRILVRLHPLQVLMGCIAIGWLWRALVFSFFCRGSTCSSYQAFFLSTQLIGCLDEFGFGIVLCRMMVDKDRFFPVGSLYRNPWLWLATAGFLAWLALAVFWRWAVYWEFWWMVIFWKTLAGMSFFALLATAIWSVSLIKLNKPVFGPLWYLGEISYGIYLWHRLVIASLEQVKVFTASELLGWVLFFTILLSAFSWHFVEKPLIRQFH